MDLLIHLHYLVLLLSERSHLRVVASKVLVVVEWEISRRMKKRVRIDEVREEVGE